MERLGTETPGRRFEAPIAPEVPSLEPPLPPSEPTASADQGRDLPETSDPPDAALDSSDLTEDPGESCSDVEGADQPWFVRWSSRLSSLRRRETQVPTLFDRSLDLDTTAEPAAPALDPPDEAEDVNALQRLERILNSRTTPLTEDEIEALRRRRPPEILDR